MKRIDDRDYVVLIAVSQRILALLRSNIRICSCQVSKFKRKDIKLTWSNRLLQDGFVIVDSPEVGESDIMDDIVVNYLPNAFAFIYVIKSSNAGGVQSSELACSTSA
nr:uncharacterized protein LOC131775109 [Pocillopora verrucosa]